MTTFTSDSVPDISLPLKDVVTALVASGRSHVDAKLELAAGLQDGTFCAHAASSKIVSIFGVIPWQKPPATIFDDFDRKEVPNKSLRAGGVVPISLLQSSINWPNDAGSWRLDMNALCIMHKDGKRSQRELFWDVSITRYSHEQSGSPKIVGERDSAPTVSSKGTKRASAWDAWIAEIALYTAQNGSIELSGPKLSEEIDARLRKRGLPGIGEKGIAPARAVVMLLRRSLDS